jgi:hypothetical protein
MQLPNSVEQKDLFELGIMLHDFRIAPQSRRISPITFNPYWINVAAQRARCAHTVAPKELTSTLHRRRAE